MPGKVSFDEPVFQQLMNSNLSLMEIEKDLRDKGFSADAIVELMKELKKKRIAKRQSTGFIYMAIGAFMGFLSCVLTIANVFPQSTGFVLYGLTSIAVILVVAGLYLVFD